MPIYWYTDIYTVKPNVKGWVPVNSLWDLLKVSVS
jgi:hypothetical protein